MCVFSNSAGDIALNGKKKHEINVRETLMGNREWTIQKHWQYLVKNTEWRKRKQKTQHRKLKECVYNRLDIDN